MPAALIAASCVMFSCQHERKNEIERIPRDTTITAENSYTKIFIDSMMVESFVINEKIQDSTAQRIRNFYNKRNYSYAWFTDTSITVQAQAFWSLHDNHLNYTGDSSVYQDRLHTVMATLLDADTLDINPDTLALTELRLTAHFLNFMKQAYGARANPENLQWNIPARQLSLETLMDSLAASRKNVWQPLNRFFHRMQNAVFTYNAIEQKGGWDTISRPSKPLSPGHSDPVVREVKERLALLKLFPASDTTELFNDTLAAQVQRLRRSYDLSERPLIDTELINQMNVPVNTRLRKMFINLERFKWLPDEPEKYMLVNIPDYRLYVLDSGDVALQMKVVVGKAVNRTVIFSGDLKFVVFRPYWNVPTSIVKNEIIPAMAKSGSYLQRNNFEVTGYRNGLPIVRQKPGPNNALGLVKFLFPNEYNIYLHDTNARSLFERDERAFSHGCIRVQKPFELAKYLLKKDTAWTDTRIRKAMNGDNEKWVTLDEPVKVFVVYITSWVDRDGFVNFRKDIYSHDQNMAKVLFE